MVEKHVEQSGVGGEEKVKKAREEGSVRNVRGKGGEVKLELAR